MESKKRSRSLSLSSTIPSKKKKTRKNIQSRLTHYGSLGKDYTEEYKLNHYLCPAIFLYFNYKYFDHAQIILHDVIKNTIPGITFIHDDFGVCFKTCDVALYTTKNLKKAAKLLTNLIVAASWKKERKIICIPLKFCLKIGAHANVIIFRKDLWRLEYYEPHGDRLYCKYIYISDKQTLTIIDVFCEMLHQNLIKYFHQNISWFPPKRTCPMKNGPQYYDPYEIGRCELWMMLFVQLAITSPNVTSRSFMKRFQTINSNENLVTKHENIAKGFEKHFNTIMIRYYHIDIASIFKADTTDPNFERFKKEIDDAIARINSRTAVPDFNSRSQYLLKPDVNISPASEINYSSMDSYYSSPIYSSSPIVIDLTKNDKAPTPPPQKLEIIDLT